jgi:hypothetical protein
MEQTECSETSAHKIQTPGNYPEENIQQYMFRSELHNKIWNGLGSLKNGKYEDLLVINNENWNLFSVQ